MAGRIGKAAPPHPASKELDQHPGRSRQQQDQHGKHYLEDPTRPVDQGIALGLNPLRSIVDRIGPIVLGLCELEVLALNGELFELPLSHLL